MNEQVTFENLTIKIESSENEAIYTFVGDVNENFKQEDVPRIKKERIVFQLRDISNFNSCGIREWIYFVRDIGQLGHLEFHNCAVTVIDQINMVPDSLGNGSINSFFAPYYCVNHGEINLLIDVQGSHLVISQKKAPILDCPQCGKALEFDALEESYFLFADDGIQSAS